MFVVVEGVVTAVAVIAVEKRDGTPAAMSTLMMKPSHRHCD